MVSVGASTFLRVLSISSVGILFALPALPAPPTQQNVQPNLVSTTSFAALTACKFSLFAQLTSCKWSIFPSMKPARINDLQGLDLALEQAAEAILAQRGLNR